MKSTKTITLLLVFIFSLSLDAKELITLKTRDNITQKFILLKPKNPRATVILFAGGKGNLNLSLKNGTPHINWGKNNFLIRSRNWFLKQNFMVAIVDAPSDKKTKEGMYGGFRNSKEHVRDMDVVIAYVQQIKDIPVWLVGTSRGSESVSNIAINSQQKPAGLILTSSVTVSMKKGKAITEQALGKITVPTLIIAHEKDNCKVTPASNTQRIAEQLTSSSKVVVKIFSGGDKPISKPCQAKSYHGYFGIEKEVVDYIADFIKSNQ